MEEIVSLSPEAAFFSETQKIFTGSGELICFDSIPELFAVKKTSRENKVKNKFLFTIML